MNARLMGAVVLVGAMLSPLVRAEDEPKLRTKFQGDPAFVPHLAFSPDGKLLASGGSCAIDGTPIKLWDVATGKLKSKLQLRGAPFKGISFSPDGKRLATVHDGRFEFSVWDLATSKPTTIKTTHTGGVTTVAFSPDGKTLATGSFFLNKARTGDGGGEVKFWDAATLKEKASFRVGDELIRGFAFSPDGKLLSLACEYNKVRIWDIDAGKEKAPFNPLELKECFVAHVDCVPFSPDGKLLAVGGSGHHAVLLDAQTGAKRFAASLDIAVDALAFTPDGKYLAAADKKNTLALLDVTTGKVKWTLKGYTNRVIAVAIAPDGKTLASTDGSGMIYIWDLDAVRVLKGDDKSAR
jgi:WD40 repeat protein